MSKSEERLLGYNITTSTVNECAREIVTHAKTGTTNCQILACMNPHSYATAKNDIPFQAALKQCEWLVPDGSGVVLGARILNVAITERVTGPDIFMACLDIMNKEGGSVFFLGASSETLETIENRIKVDYPNISFAGSYSPPFKEVFDANDNRTMIEVINGAKPDLLWVGMTAPKQEKWLSEHRNFLNVGAAGAIGAAFDFFAGTVDRSSPVFQKYNLEWLPRLLRQPKKLWRRTFVSAPIFLFDIFKDWAKRY